jgi:hypothetical protein
MCVNKEAQAFFLETQGILNLKDAGTDVCHQL